MSLNEVPKKEPGVAAVVDMELKKKNDDDKKDDDTKSDKEDADLKEEIKQKFLEWCEYCTTHGIPNIARNQSKLIRLIWIACLLASSTYCFYSIITLMMSYLSYNVLINMQVIEEAPIFFPVKYSLN